MAARHFLRDELFLVEQDGRHALWHYRSAPQRRLVSRDPVELARGREHHLHPQAGVIAPTLDLLSDGHLNFAHPAHGRRHSALVAPPQPDAMASSILVEPLSDGFLVAVGDGQGQRLHLVRFGGDLVASLDWPRADRIGVREQPGRLVLFDPQGRALEIETASSRLRAVSLL